MFEVHPPEGGHSDYVHSLVPGELINNSFAAVSPDGLWMVSGEWFDITRLLVFPTPILNPQSEIPGAALPLACTVQLSHPVRNVQGATFITPTTLLCSTDDPGSDLWPSPRQVLQVELARPLDGTETTASVSFLGPAPRNRHCSGSSETEGIDYDDETGDLRLAVVSGGWCRFWTFIYRYRRSE
jgi:hypothetical protein